MIKKPKIDSVPLYVYLHISPLYTTQTIKQ